MLTKREDYNAYMRRYMAARYARRRGQIIEQLGSKCNQCNSTSNLEIDHIDAGKKSFDIGKRLAGIAERKLAEEVKKCQLLCGECHEEKSIVDTGKQRAKGTHGTLSAFKHCKCDLCKKAKADYMREYHQRRRASKANSCESGETGQTQLVQNQPVNSHVGSSPTSRTSLKD